MRTMPSVLLLTGVLALGGCSTGPPSSAAGTSSATPVTPSADRTLSGELLQYRRDVPARRLQVRLTARVPGVVVDRLELRAPGLPAAPASAGGTELREGAPLDFPVVLAAADCGVAPGAPTAQVALHDAAGSRTVRVPLDDDGLVRRLHAGDCADQALRAQAEIVVTAVRPTADGRAALVTIRLRRVGGSDPVRVTGTRANTVYDVEATGELPTLRRSGTATLRLRMVPARCDVHALGESYRTGIITLVVAAGDDRARPFDVVPPDELRARLEALAVDACRTAPD